MSKQVNLSDNLKQLSDIANWFDEQQSVDVEEGLEKVKQAATLIKESKQRLKAIENEFEEIKKDIETTDEDTIETETIILTSVTEKSSTSQTEDTKENDEIPF